MNNSLKQYSLNGWLNCYKSPGITSTGLLRVLKKQLPSGIKIGHAGTLDPFASGVLMVALGEATKTMQYVMRQPKEYIASFKFGQQTDTDDLTGKVIAEKIINLPSLETLTKVIDNFKGDIWQVPPKYSAIKIDGERAYNLARQGLDFNISPKKVRVDELEIINYQPKEHRLICRIVSGSGFYVRSLARDIGKFLNTFAYVETLNRSKIGKFLAHMSISLDKLIKIIDNQRLEQLIIAIDKVLDDLPMLNLSAKQAAIVKKGGYINVQHLLSSQNIEVLRLKEVDQLIAMAKVENSVLQPLRVFNCY